VWNLQWKFIPLETNIYVTNTKEVDIIFIFNVIIPQRPTRLITMRNFSHFHELVENKLSNSCHLKASRL
jgi:hypothetical protein